MEPYGGAVADDEISVEHSDHKPRGEQGSRRMVSTQNKTYSPAIKGGNHLDPARKGLALSREFIRALYVPVNINGLITTALVNSAIDSNIISEEFFFIGS